MRLRLVLTLALALRVKVDLRVGLDGCRRVQSAIAHLFPARLCTPGLSDLSLIVLEREKVRHVICGYLLFASASYSVFMHHGFTLI